MAKMWCSSHLRLHLQLPLPPPVPAHCYSPRPISSDRKSRTNKYRKQCLNPIAASHKPEEQEEEEFRVLSAIQSIYNHIVILDTPKSRLLLLDSTNNVHSILNKSSKWTGSYWDEFAALPPIVPDGPIAIFGLGGGTAAHLMLQLWPSLKLEGWEIDKILIDMSRDYLGLGDLEKHTVDGGVLNIHIGDAFSPAAAIHGGYAGIIVDLFANGKVLPQLEEADTWLELYDKLMPNGRFMVNCGAGESQNDDSISMIDGSWKLNATIRALCKAFPGQVNWKKMPKNAGENYLALTGSLPDFTSWSNALPHELSSSVNQWRSCINHDVATKLI
ncbi:hypothetical protein ACJIZ3_002368 [Penstemon smallii]|uniref:Uncharacterized protein n=1 Tax=Penstemon smallii TaxID=265156 RepID=A0ABD3U7K5_9LAMI